MSITQESRRPSLSVRRSSAGNGRGLFAHSRLVKGDVVAEYTGPRIPTSYADLLSTRYLFEIDEKWTIDGSTRKNIARYINHSCAPNCEADLREGRIFICAACDIAPGEELTIDYGDEYFDEFIRPHGCKCQRCAGQ